MFGSLTRAVTGVILTPVATVADFVTLGGTLTGRDRSYTAETAEDIMDNLKNATKPIDTHNDER
ncbi:hypothetical protein EBT16_09525 [bacterium]|nr:hypothetical protein [bacterium]